MKKNLISCLAVLLLAGGCGVVAPESGEAVPAAVQERSVAPADYLLAQAAGGTGWSRVHAAEGLLAAGREVESVREIFTAELAKSEPAAPWRVGVLRVLSLADPERRAGHQRELIDIAMNIEAAGVVHAVETLGKLNLRLNRHEQEVLRNYVQFAPKLKSYSLLLLAVNRDGKARNELLKLLASGDIPAAMGFYYLPPFRPRKGDERFLAALDQACRDPEQTPLFRAFAFRSLLRYAKSYTEAYHAELLERIAGEEDAGALRFYLLAAGDFKRPEDRALLEGYFAQAAPALRIAAASALLQLPEEETR